MVHVPSAWREFEDGVITLNHIANGTNPHPTAMNHDAPTQI